MPRKIAAVGYVRMSTDKQETSPEQQRFEIEAFADANNYRIDRWYEDLGISGDRTDKRLQFQQMIADGSDGKFIAILCWNQDRFGRFDAIEAGRWIHPLREAGVHLATVTDGVIDWHSMAGRITYNVVQEGKHQFLRDLSANVTRAMNGLANAGKWVAGVPPVGYVVDDDKMLQLGPAEDVALVQEIFRRYAAGESLRNIAQWLRDKGIKSPKGKTWTTTGISNVLKNERYLGYMIYNQRSSSKYRDGSPNPKGRMKTLPRSEWTIIEDTHPAIVDRETFDVVQELLKTNTRKTHPNPDKLTALSGILRCGKCGYGMFCDRSNGVPQYTCYSYRERPGECERFTIREADGLRVILTAMKTEYFDVVLSDANINAVRERMREILHGTDGTEPASTILGAQLAKLDSQIDQARTRLVEVSNDMIEHVERRLRELQDQRDSVARSLAMATSGPEKALDGIERQVEAASAWMSKLEAIADTDYDGNTVNRMLREFIDRVELDMHREQWGPSGKRFRCVINGGRIWLKSSEFGLIETSESCHEHLASTETSESRKERRSADGPYRHSHRSPRGSV
ncbi:MAG: recombinase family protein [Planctomycetota bacterium]